jgi:hypothetical protein
MQNDLISRSALLEAYHEMGISMNPDVFEEDVEELINNQPCAYDVEKVVAELEELKLKRSDDSVYGVGVLNGYSEAIDYIVRNSGKE